MLNITQAVTQSVRGTFDYAGRARRSEYWWTWLFVMLLIIASGLLEVLIAPEVSETDMQDYYGGSWKAWLLDWKYTPLSTGLYYLTFPTLLAVTARRMHDVGRRGWIGIVPILAMEVVVLFTATDLANGFYDIGAGQAVFAPKMIIALGFWLIVIFLGLYSFFLSIRDSERVSNQFGASPKYFDEANAFD